MFKFITHRPLWLNIATGLLLAVAIFFIFIFSLNKLTHHDESRTVPSVAGKSFEQAEDILDKAGFDIMIQDSIYVDTIKPLMVIKQVPEADEVVKVNRTVYLTINRAVPPMIPMPNLVGYSIRSAEMELKNLGLRLGDTIFQPNFAKNAVLEQRYNGDIIAAGTKIRQGSTISFVLGSGVGNEKFIVPHIVGLTFGEAKRILEANGLGIGAIVASGISDTTNAYIYRQNPERFNDEKKFQYIRTGQLMDVWLQEDKPVTDSTDITIPD